MQNKIDLLTIIARLNSITGSMISELKVIYSGDEVAAVTLVMGDGSFYYQLGSMTKPEEVPA